MWLTQCQTTLNSTPNSDSNCTKVCRLPSQLLLTQGASRENKLITCHAARNYTMRATARYSRAESCETKTFHIIGVPSHAGSSDYQSCNYQISYQINTNHAITKSFMILWQSCTSRRTEMLPNGCGPAGVIAAVPGFLCIASYSSSVMPASSSSS